MKNINIKCSTFSIVLSKPHGIDQQGLPVFERFSIVDPDAPKQKTRLWPGIATALEGEVQQAAEKSMKPRAKKDDEDCCRDDKDSETT